MITISEADVMRHSISLANKRVLILHISLAFFCRLVNNGIVVIINRLLKCKTLTDIVECNVFTLLFSDTS